MTKLLLFLFLALFVSFMCSILEAVLLSTSLPYINSLEKAKRKGAKLLKKLKTKIDQPIAAILSANTIAHTIGAAGVGAESVKLFGEQYMFLVSAILTLLILYLSEIIPKTIGALYWKRLAIPSSYLINGLIYITYPLTIFAEFLTRFFANKEKLSISREELLANAQMSETAGEINEDESDIIENTLTLSQSIVKDIMTPRTVVFALNKDTQVKSAITFMENLKTFSRIPIYDADIDHITGLTLSKDILWKTVDGSEETLEDFAYSITTIDEESTVLKALSLMLSKNEHLFLVKDNFGQTAGVVSMEDCLETLLGKEIMDESDKVEDMQELAKKILNQKK